MSSRVDACAVSSMLLVGIRAMGSAWKPPKSRRYEVCEGIGTGKPRIPAPARGAGTSEGNKGFPAAASPPVLGSFTTMLPYVVTKPTCGVGAWSEPVRLRPKTWSAAWGPSRPGLWVAVSGVEPRVEKIMSTFSSCARISLRYVEVPVNGVAAKTRRRSGAGARRVDGSGLPWLGKVVRWTETVSDTPGSVAASFSAWSVRRTLASRRVPPFGSTGTQPEVGM